MSAHVCEVCGATPANKIGGYPWLCDAHFWVQMNEGIDRIMDRASRLPSTVEIVAALRADRDRLAAEVERLTKALHEAEIALADEHGVEPPPAAREYLASLDAQTEEDGR